MHANLGAISRASVDGIPSHGSVVPVVGRRSRVRINQEIEPVSRGRIDDLLNLKFKRTIRD